MRKTLLALGTVLAGILPAGCGDPTTQPAPSDPWPTDYTDIMAAGLTDPVGDLRLAPGGAPPYRQPVGYPPVDITRLSLGIHGKYLYMRADFSGPLPGARVSIPHSGEVEAQEVSSQAFNISVDSDNDDATGAWGEGIAGVDIFFAVKLEYGQWSTAYANFGFPPPGNPHYRDIHYNSGHIEGQMGPGGPGASYIIVRMDVSSLGTYLRPGSTVEIGGWSEAESNLYHHFAFDPLAPGQWTLQP
ncbi:MAG: hypothetical protein HZB25_08450 [Candidatus Eisenbacteria bacterium]|nr:hypothetical protein [Candidatus Eisenbacteria bacterium]